MTNNAPKRIWRWLLPNSGNWVEYADHPIISPFALEYIQVDHAQAELQAAVAAEREACAEVAANFFDQQPGRVIAEIIRDRSKGGQ